MSVEGLELNFFNDLITNLETSFSSDKQYSDIIDWLDNGGVDKERLGIELTKEQRLILAMYYGLELTEEQISIVEYWKINDRTTYDFDLGPIERQNLICEAGRRSGKSLLGSLIINYEFERLCRMESPQKHFGIAASTLISIICVAPSAEQASKTIYGQAKAMMYNVYFLRRLIDAKKIDPQEKMIKYEEKLIYIYSGNSKSETQVGGSPILIVLDEGALFEDKDGRSNALLLWDNLGAGGLVFRDKAKRVIISSAWKTGDALEVLYKDAKGAKGWIGFRLRSWDVNPIFAARDNPVIDSMYIRDRNMAQLLFEGIRTSGINSYFEPDSIKASFNLMSGLYARELPISDDKLIRLQIDEIDEFNGQTIMHIDPSITGDAYGMAYGHSYMMEGKLHVNIDGILAWIPRAGCSISIINVQNAIYNIHLHRPLQRVTTDGHDSSETIQRLRLAGIASDKIVFSTATQLAMYDTVRKLAAEGRLHLPKNSPWTERLKDELLGLQYTKTPNGTVRVDHIPGSGSKDIADCVAAVCWQLARDSFDNTIDNRTKLSFLRSKKNSEALITTEEENGFDGRQFMSDVRSRKKGWGGLDKLKNY